MNDPCYFSANTFRFLDELKANNSREWFNNNKDRYEEHIKAPTLKFIKDFAGPLKKISNKYSAIAKINGGSMFRIYRDTRFSRDKTPYKTWIAARFNHVEAAKTPAPGFYMHLARGDVVMAAGIWHPPSPALGRIRQFIANNPQNWKSIVGSDTLKGFDFHGESLKRAPQGFDPEHELIDHIKRKDFALFRRYDERLACSPDFMPSFVRDCNKVAPFVDYLCAALGLDF
ncbi:MAG: TIGR02453 family protein [Lysobacteraceae bacterium]|nr:MAG: TIGR02453 family protein [Xanthomonadaceae bacterium]